MTYDPDAPVPMGDANPDDEGMESSLPEGEDSHGIDDDDAGADDGDLALDLEV